MTAVMFALECTWLALHVWASEHGPVLLAAAVALVQPRPERWRGRKRPLDLLAAS
jgi:hypothetical protein